MIQKEQNLLFTVTTVVVAAVVVMQTTTKETKLFILQTQQKVSFKHVNLNNHSVNFMILLQWNYILV